MAKKSNKQKKDKKILSLRFNCFELDDLYACEKLCGDYRWVDACDKVRELTAFMPSPISTLMEATWRKEPWKGRQIWR